MLGKRRACVLVDGRVCRLGCGMKLQPAASCFTFWAAAARAAAGAAGGRRDFHAPCCAAAGRAELRSRAHTGWQLALAQREQLGL